jgi:AAA15 family ATPase/GTPase
LGIIPISMLLQFFVSNYRSIRNEQVFTLLADKSVKENADAVITDGNSNALSSAVVYGRNASGKSNLLKAIQAIKYMVIQSASFKVGTNIQTYEPYLLDKLYSNKPVEFKIEFVAADSIKYRYEIGYTETAIIYERLYSFPKLQSAKLFERDGLHITYGDRVTGRKKDIEETLYENQLYLSKIGSFRLEALYHAFHFFDKLLETFMVHNSRQDEVLLELFLDRMKLDPQFSSNITKLIRAADTNIQSFNLDAASKDLKTSSSKINQADQTDFLINIRQVPVRARHQLFSGLSSSGEIDFSLTNESAGTLKLMTIGGIILVALAEGQVLVIDELSNSLHPKVTKALVKLFNDPLSNPKKAQLIFTTHEVSLLDNELFRRDQVWLSEKEFEGYSHYYTLADIAGVRKDSPWEKWYMNGRLGATPVINDLELDFTL